MDLPQARNVTQGMTLIYKLHRSKGSKTVKVEALGSMNSEREIPVVTVEECKSHGKGTRILARIDQLELSQALADQLQAAGAAAFDRMRAIVNKIGEGLK